MGVMQHFRCFRLSGDSRGQGIGQNMGVFVVSLARAFVVAARNARSFGPCWRVIECALLSGFKMRHFQKPRAGMVISGSGPNLASELSALRLLLVFPIPICSIV